MSSELDSEKNTRTGGRAATEGVIPGRYALSVGKPTSIPPHGWTWISLSTVARLETGHTPSRKHPEYWGGDVPWVGIRDATGNHGTTIFRTQQYTNNLGISNSSSRVLPKNTVCLSRTASVGYVVVMGVPMATSQDFVNWVCSDAIDYRFLKYILLAEHDSMLRFASGTTHQTIYFPEAKAFHVCLPSLKVQNAIADLLQLLDDRIALLRETNTTLESIAQALFKSWFVDFDPVHANAGTQTPSLPPEIQDLFPSTFVESPLGLVPEGWELGRLEDLLVLQRGFDLPSTERVVGDYLIIAASGPSGTHEKAMVKGPGVVTGRSGVLGKVFFTLDDYWPLNTTLWIKEFRRASPCFAFEILSRLDLLSFNAGSAVPSLNRNHVHGLPYLLPPRNVVDEFESIAMLTRQQMAENNKRIVNVSGIRDTLLPRLISGQLRLSDVQELVEELS